MACLKGENSKPLRQEDQVAGESLTKLGSIMGSGGLVIIDDSTSMPEFARFFMDFCVDESCGKCVPCRVGTVQIRSILDKLISGEGTHADLEKLENLCELVKQTSLCGLGQSAPNPVMSTLKFFMHEYEDLIQDLIEKNDLEEVAE
jgi:bidirectional [NiFe] hydrogenase diaphorase subunit